MVSLARIALLATVAAGSLWLGCSPNAHKVAADKEVYGILSERQREALGTTNSFTINTRYSDRKPQEVLSPEIIHERLMASKRSLSLAEALQIALDNSRDYQFRKETVYLTALTLTAERYNFQPHPFASSKMTFTRESTGELKRQVHSEFGFDQLLKSGGQLGVSFFNDMLRYYTGDPRATHTTLMAADFMQPLLRGAGTAIATENLTQAERNVIYELRSFAHYQRTFAVDIATSYFRLLQQKDTVRNDYSNYQSLVVARDRAEALGVDRLPAFQVDQARQDELRAKSRYILSVQRYQGTLDDFKIKLGLPLGMEIGLDDKELEEMHAVGLLPVAVTDAQGYELAVKYRLDLLNEIDKFEDSKRKIEVAINRLLPDLNIFASASLNSVGPTDYTRFDFNQYTAAGGVELKLPLDRLKERNEYRTTLVKFEQQLRALALALDNVRDEIRQDLRTLELTRKEYDIQKNAVDLANSRVEGTTLLLQAGRVQMRDLLEAQSALVTAKNALTAAMVEYHAARWGLLRDLGVIRTDMDRFWLAKQTIPVQAGAAGAVVPQPDAERLIPPDELFKK
jgi:outer membrane protein TolC